MKLCPKNILSLFFVMISSLLINQNVFSSELLQDSDSQRAYNLYREGKIEQAVSLYTMKAYEGSAIAQYNLAAIFSRDTENVLYRQEVAFWLKSAAELGDADAQFNLAMLSYNDNEDVNRLENTVSWLTMAAEKGYLKAQYNLGYLAFSNLEISVSRQKGVEWLQKAAKNRNARALKLITLLQENKSEGVPKLYAMDLKLKQGPAKKVYSVKNNDVEIFAFPVSRQIPLRLLQQGTIVEIRDQKKDWFAIQVEDSFPSWVAKEELNITGRIAEVAGIEASLYVEPVLDKSVFKIGVIDRSVKLQVIEYNGNWIKVKTPDYFLAWVRQSDITSTEINLVAEEQNIPTETRELSSVNDSTVPEPASKKEFNSNNLRKLLPEPKVPQTTEVKTESVKLVKDFSVYSSKNSGLLGLISKGKQVEVLEFEQPYSKVTWSGGIEAWMFGKFLAVNEDGGKVTGDNVRVRVAPNTSKAALVIGSVRKGESYQVAEKRGDWYRIILDPAIKQGWLENL